VTLSGGSKAPIRVDLQIIADMIEPGSRVLDIGCGDGALLAYLSGHKQVDGRGLELSMEGVNRCVRNGLSVIQGDADQDLKDYPAGAFDYAVLSQTLQATRHPKEVLEHLGRIGRRAIVSFPNYGYWRTRLGLLLSGRMATTGPAHESWYDTPNIHRCTIRDFIELCRDVGLVIERGISLDSAGRTASFAATSRAANLFGEQALFLLRSR
jgi:methionine biosynthesis protein MetW